MNTNDVIYEDGIYKIKFIKTIASPGEIIVNNEKHSTSGHKGFEFSLLKNDEPFKFYSLATGYPYNYESMKQTIIEVFKKYML